MSFSTNLEQFRCCVGRGPAEGVEMLVQLVHGGREPKVANFDAVGTGEEDVLRLQVAVDEEVLVLKGRSRVSRDLDEKLSSFGFDALTM